MRSVRPRRGVRSVMMLVLWVLIPWLLIVFGGWLLYQLLRQNGRILRRLETLERQLARPAGTSLPAPAPPPGLPVGTQGPDFRLADLAGSHRQLSDWRGRRLLLIFFNPGCGFCSRMLPELAALPVDPVGDRPLPLVVT